MDLITLSAAAAAAHTASGSEPAEATDAEFNQTVLLLHGDGSEGAGDTSNLGNPNYKAFRDNSTSANPIEVYGDTYGTDFSPYYYADGYWSNEFDGTDNLRFSNEDVFDLGGQDFTLECWVYPHAKGQYHLLIQKWDSPSNKTFAFQISNSNYIQFVYTTNGSTNANLTGTTEISPGVWTHVAASRNNGTLKLFINGVADATDSSFTAVLYNSSAIVTVGSDADNNNYTDAHISNARFIKGRGIYTSDFTPPTAPFTDPSVAGEMSVEFDGSNDGLDGIGASDSNLQFGTSDFTVECWIYKKGNPGGDAGIIDMRPNATNGMYLMIGIANDGELFVYINSAYKIAASSSTALNTNSWHHIAYTRDYSSTTGTLYIDGVSVGTWTDNSNYNETNTELNIGFHNYSGSFVNGFISNVRICKSLVYNSAFTPSTSPFTTTSQSATNCVFLGCRAKSFIDESTNNFTIPLLDAPRVSEFSPFNDGYWSVDFDGTGDYLTVGGSNETDFDYGTNDFCVEFWFTYDADAGSGASQHDMVSKWDNTGGQNDKGWMIGIEDLGSGDKVRVYYTYDGSTNYNMITTTTVQQNRWHHVAWVCNSGTLALYLDGVSEATASRTSSLRAATIPVLIGATHASGSATQFMPGKISNLRIVNGSPVYTENFTPSTSPLTSTGSETKLLTCQSNRFIDNSDSGHSLTVNGDTGISDFIPFELLSRQTKFITCQSYRFKDVITDRYALTINSEPRVSTLTPFTVTKTPNVGSGFFAEGFTNTGYLQIPSSSLGADSSTFVIGLWFYPIDNSVVGLFDSGPSQTNVFRNYGNNQIQDQNGGTVTFTGDYDVYGWNWMCIVKNDTSFEVFINDVSVGTASCSSALTELNFVIGTINVGGAGKFNGYIADFIFVDNSTTQITTPTSTLSAVSGTTLLTCQYSGAVRNRGFLDDSKFNHEVTRFGDTHMGTFSPFSLEDGYWSTYFKGSGAYQTFPNSSAFAFGTGAFTIEFWFNGPLNSDKFILSGRAAIGTLHITFGGYGGSTAGSLRYVGSSTITTGTDLISDNTWHHCAIERDGSNNVVLYIDGVSKGTGTDTTNYTTTTGTWYFPCNDVGQGNQPTGNFSNFRIVKGSNIYGGAFSPPSSPLTAVTNTQLLIQQSNRFIDNSTNDITITNSGTPEVQPFSPFAPTRSYSKDVVGGSAYFDGSGDRLSVALSGVTDLLNKNFTVEGWYYATYTGSARNGAIFSQGNSGVYAPLNVYQYGTGMRFNMSSTGSSWDILSDSTTYGSGKGNLFSWNHIAVCRDGSTVSAFLNGERVHTLTTSATLYDTTQPTCIGDRPDGAVRYVGYIGPWRFVTGETIYDPSLTTLTVPTAPFPDTANSVLMFNFDNAGIFDHTMKNNLEPETNTRVSTIQKKFSTGSIYFDGGDAINVPMRPYLAFGTGDVTVEAFVYPDSVSGIDTIFDTRVSGSYGNDSFSFQINGGTVQVWAGSYSPSSVLIEGGTISTGTWTHIAFTRENGTNRLFVDGTEITNNTNAWNQTFTSTNLLTIGNTIGQSRYFDGYIDELRITKGVARYTTDFTVPAEAFANR